MGCHLVMFKDHSETPDSLEHGRPRCDHADHSGVLKVFTNRDDNAVGKGVCDHGHPVEFRSRSARHGTSDGSVRAGTLTAGDLHWYRTMLKMEREFKNLSICYKLTLLIL